MVGFVKRPPGGTCAKRHRMRCGHGKQGCYARFTLRRHPDQYVRPVRCPYCKSLNVHSVEKARRAEQKKQDTCYCGNYPFPHRKGSLRMCMHHPSIHEEPTDEEKDDYYRCMDTPRSA